MIYRPRTSKAYSMLLCLPATSPELVESGFDRNRIVHKLSKLQSDSVVVRKHVTYHLVIDIMPTYGVRIENILRAGPMTAREISEHGMPLCRVWTALQQLEKTGVIVVDSSMRPFRYHLPSRSMVSGLEALAAYEAAR